jgi:hypothetical protein
MPSIRSLYTLASMLAVAAFATPAGAHDQTYPVAGDAILIQTGSPGSEVFQFEAIGPEVPFLDHNPLEDGTEILVRGLGANAGRSALATLDRNLWAATAGGYAYSDPSGTRGGITHVIFEPGRFEIQGGAGFSWSPAGAQDEVWVHMRIGDTGLCSRFQSSDATTNAAGHFVASGAAAVSVCPRRSAATRSRSRPKSATTATSRPATAARKRAWRAPATRRAIRPPSRRSRT